MAIYTRESLSQEVKPRWSVITSPLVKPDWYVLGTQEQEIDEAWALYSNTRGSLLSELLLGDMKLRSQVEILKNFGTTSGTATTMERGTLFEAGSSTRTISSATVQTSVKQLLRQNQAMSGTAQGAITPLPKEIVADTGQHLRKGSVLNDGWWWPFKNDAWILGGVHGLKRFHLALATVPDELLWDKASKRPRVLGRELLGLHLAGYKLIGLPAWTIKKTWNAWGKEQSSTTPVSAKTIRESIGFVFAPTSKVTAESLTFTGYQEAINALTGIDDIKNTILNEAEAIAFDAYDFDKVIAPPATL
ncbi:hypothetical protein LMK08_16275 [Metapseudomonas furukawaii]|uniref:hypothetical protein n=1 Tax=Metapseudomonas furukawaii TaxID=1149133 RepID=UPI00227D238F|nr:hypothetical protein [Pseudomonas furukawaii]WAG76930.1 hypothetical protein LMK08_16275 [Pseudomonas furukawaii]